MPYIPESDRLRVSSGDARTPGELNYMMTILMIANWQDRETMIGVFQNFRITLRRAMDNYWNDKGATGYVILNDILGAMAGAIMEFSRRVKIDNGADAEWLHRLTKVISSVVHEFYTDVAVPYETKKIEENGDVYPV